MKRTNTALLVFLGAGAALAALPISHGATQAASSPQQSPMPGPSMSSSPMPNPTTGTPMP